MSARNSTPLAMRLKRKMRVRKTVTGTPERPRLTVTRSAKNLYAQVIDDYAGTTLAAIASNKKGQTKRATVAVCKELGKQLAERCKAKNITQVVFDKNGYRYHGRVKALADGAREGGLQF